MQDSLAESVTRFTEILDKMSRFQKQGVRHWLRATERLDEILEAMKMRGDGAFKVFEGVANQIAAAVKPLDAAAALLETLEKKVAEIAGAAGGVSVALDGIRSVLDGELVPAGRSLHDAATDAKAGAAAFKTQAESQEKAASLFESSADQFDKTSRLCEEGVRRWLRATEGLDPVLEAMKTRGDNAFKVFEGAADQIAAAVKPLGVATASLETLEEKVAEIAGAAGAVAASLDKLRSVLTDELAPAGRSLLNAATDAKAGAAAFKTQADSQEKAAGLLQSSAEQLKESIKSLDEGVKSLKAGLKKFDASATKVESAAGKLDDFAGKSIKPVQESFSELNALLDDCRKTAADLGKMPALQNTLAGLLQSLEKAGQIAAEVVKLPTQVKVALDASTKQLSEGAASAFSTLGKAVEDSQQVVRELPAQLRTALQETRTSIAEFSARMLDEQMERMEQTLEHILERKAARS